MRGETVDAAWRGEMAETSSSRISTPVTISFTSRFSTSLYMAEDGRMLLVSQLDASEVSSADGSVEGCSSTTASTRLASSRASPDTFLVHLLLPLLDGQAVCSQLGLVVGVCHELLGSSIASSGHQLLQQHGAELETDELAQIGPEGRQSCEIEAKGRGEVATAARDELGHGSNERRLVVFGGGSCRGG